MDELIETLANGQFWGGAGAPRDFLLRAVHVGEGCWVRLGEWALARNYKRALVVADERTLEAAGRQAVAALEQAGLIIAEHRLSEAGGHDPSADEAEVERAVLAGESTQPDVVVAVGAGTVTDVAKMSATRRGLPWISVPTAPSMNGFTSGIAAILVRGVKRTLPARQTEAVFADPQVLSRAPHHLVAAGFADLSSKPFSNACWLLSSVMEGAAYSREAAELLDGPFRETMDAASGIGAHEPRALAILMKTLVLSGCSMALAGSSAPASGGEHLISHYWDMVEHAAGRPVRALHGLQVGVATVLSASLYERVLSLPVPALAGRPDWLETRLTGRPESPAARADQVRSRHPDLPVQVVEELVQQSLAKFVGPEILRERLLLLGQTWESLVERLHAILWPSQTLLGALAAAGAPTWASQLDVDNATLSHTVRVCRDMRARYTVLDFADDLGVLDEFAASLFALERAEELA